MWSIVAVDVLVVVVVVVVVGVVGVVVVVECQHFVVVFAGHVAAGLGSVAVLGLEVLGVRGW